RLIEELETQAEALEGRSMSLTMRYLNFWLLHHIETTDKPHAKRVLAAGLGNGTGAEQVAAREPEGLSDSPPAAAAARDLERWHQAVRRGLWIAPEPKRPPGELH
ncbi:MAG: hypothetical protein ACREU5_12765, partial [Burkholderiales bacterium]